MIDTVVILDRKNINATLAGIWYDKWGQKTNQQIIICDSWDQGFVQAKTQGHNRVMFVKSGTVFLDWNKWVKLLDNYPHQGLIAHLICKKDQRMYIDDQCWFLDLTKFDIDDLNLKNISQPTPIISSIMLHDDYTPLWARPGLDQQTYTTDNFGQGLIARQFNRNQAIINWNNSFRDLKFFCYCDTNIDYKINEKFKDYLSLAENQLWVFNNEDFVLTKNEKLVTPGSGVFWILNMLQPNVQEIQIVDISRVQINFCNELWNNWDGCDYGTFAYNFIKRNNLKHFEIDQMNLSKLDRVKFMKPINFISYVNQKFDQLLAKHKITNFTECWKHAKHSKILNTSCDNLVHWLLAHPDMGFDVWKSNILDYKWTKLKTSKEDCDKFKAYYG
jgi:hypothetical protein